MSRFATLGVVSGLLSAAAGLSVAAGYPAVGAFLNDSATAQTATVLLSALFALVAGSAEGVAKR